MYMKHIVICGEKKTGKSTLIERLISQCTLPIYGFYTRTTARREDGYHSIYLYPAGSKARPETARNHVGDCNSRQRTVHPEVFNELGVEYLQHRHDGLIVMDELGFMEAGAEAFCQTVLRCFDGSTPVLAVCKARYDVAFLDQVRNHSKVQVYTITKENRDALYRTLLPVIRTWNGEMSNAKSR